MMSAGGGASRPPPSRTANCLRLCTSAGEALPRSSTWWDETIRRSTWSTASARRAYRIYISNRPGRGRSGTIQAGGGPECRVVTDETGTTVPDVEVGVLEGHAGETVALEYCRRRSSGAFSGDTLVTGGLFVRDADGFFSYRGRADDLLKVGWHLGLRPARSRTASSVPDVLECAVIGHEHEGLVRPRAYVVLETGRGPFGGVADRVCALWAFAAQAPAGRPVRRRTARSANGKLDRRALRRAGQGRPMTGGSWS